MKRTLIPRLYSQEEIDKYFDGKDDPGIRYHVTLRWFQDWIEEGRYIVVDSPEVLEQLKEFVKTHKIRKVNYVKNANAWAFRYEDDYFAIRFALS